MGVWLLQMGWRHLAGGVVRLLVLPPLTKRRTTHDQRMKKTRRLLKC
jgi:hypothetical protein